MDYRESIRKAVGTNARALEIGPSYGPILPKAQGFKTTVFDHLTKDELVAKYKNHGVKAHLIEDVDVIGSELKSLDDRFDAIVASHVIEHTPDLIDFLKQCSRLMHEDSRLYLITPDKRLVFDAIRPLTSTGEVIDAHLLGRQRHVGAIFDTKIHAVSRNKRNLWTPTDTNPLDTIHNFAEARQMLRDVMAKEDYVDTHAWCFTPQSFRLIMFDLMGLEFIDLVECEYYDHDRTEFFFVMKKGRVDDQLISERRAQLASASWTSQVAFNKSIQDFALRTRP